MKIADKIALTRMRMDEVLTRFGPDSVVGWTGGKDSTVVLALWRTLLHEIRPGAPVRALNLDTGCKLPEVLMFRDRLARE